MAEVTHHEPFLTLVREPLPEGVRGVYQLGYLFHLGPGTPGSDCRMRERASPDRSFFTDHPNSQVCVLADGKKHTLFSFRVLGR